MAASETGTLRLTAPLRLTTASVPEAWVDYNGHMNDACYGIAFSQAVDALMDRLGLDATGRAATGHTVYTLAALLRYVREAKRDEAFVVDGQILERDAKRLRVWLTMRRGGTGDFTGDVLATSEQLLISIDTATTRASAWPEAVAARVAALTEASAALPIPPEAGQGITLRRR